MSIKDHLPPTYILIDQRRRSPSRSSCLSLIVLVAGAAVFVEFVQNYWPILLVCVPIAILLLVAWYHQVAPADQSGRLSTNSNQPIIKASANRLRGGFRKLGEQ